MGVFETPPPQFSKAALSTFAKNHFNLTGNITSLASERDQNARIDCNDGNSYTLKLANASESTALLELQNAAIHHIAQSDPTLRVPTAIPSNAGNTIEFVNGQNSREAHALRLLQFVPGDLFSQTQKNATVLHSLGSFLGRLSCALQSFSHPAAHRPDFLWNLDNCLATKPFIDDIQNASDGEMIRAIFSRHEKYVAPKLARLRVAVIHGDANDNNIVIRTGRVTGLFDFGDITVGKQINELAIAMAYALMGESDIATASRAIIGGYTNHFSLREQELEVLFDLVEMRLAMSVCISSHRGKQFTDNDYLLVSQKPALDLLRTLTAMNTQLKICIARVSAGLPAIRESARVVEWLSHNGKQFGQIFKRDLHTQSRIIASFAEGAPGSQYTDDVVKYSQWLNQQLAENNATYAIGLYAEDRACYKGDQFTVSGSASPRSTHLGIDIFIDAGTPVTAPYPGHVYSIAYNDMPYDYGGTVILEHRAGDTGLTFYSLYGHLSKSTVDLFNAGDKILQGQVVGYIGTPEENGGWAPHVHFQLITTMLGLKGNFDGAAEPDRMDIWLQICPDPNLILQFPPQAFTQEPDQRESLLARRAALLGPNLSIAYQNKLHIVQGKGAWLYDASGRAYLDCVNNICHVGHSHPQVVDALKKQARVLNTNTRYLHKTILDYAERLADTFSDPLSVVYFVNSGSEANELALRLARTATGRKDIVALDWAYHGNTGGLVDISPYKFARKGGGGAGEYTYIAELPDPYRGRLKGNSENVARGYAASVQVCIDRIQAEFGVGPAAFIAEPISGCGGQVFFPDNYLQYAFEHVRAAGGLCIVDEVQTGFGRVGDAMWAFELQNAVPDIVTLGKPMGNGHPLAAVVTTPEIAEAFNNGMEYFNSFGGNPVSCAVGMAVLDVIEQERLRENARGIYSRLIAELKLLQSAHPLIGDIRGCGLFLGVELVEDRESLEPATRETGGIINYLRNNGVLLSTDGPHDNVLKFKPPMVFREHELTFFVEQLKLAFEHIS